MARRKNPVLEADKALQKEGEKQALLIHGAAALAMYRNWGWRKNRILDLLDKVEEVWNECAKDIEHSMIEMCETETKIEIQCGDGKNWKELHYLNHKVDPGRMTPAKWIYMRRQQKSGWRRRSSPGSCWHCTENAALAPNAAAASMRRSARYSRNITRTRRRSRPRAWKKRTS